ncbi:MAG: benzoyl-CoA reductase subunit D [Planctomycetota bacterium]|jgi:benzoyl-CoA reductase subunit D|nr:benzoyl-CoA reductase subunit D [Planctomycetota bacterium]MDP6761495.1 benzoyl-CoA reductase subunit D [Planctomycetota bacterium]MDP6988661.1 benzoyl-CoA reductase subunit D [Planctomycetota bacterium]
MTLSAGVDVGSNSVKAALVDDGGADARRLLGSAVQRIRGMDLADAVEECYEAALAAAGVEREAVDYVATTGESESVPFRTGHFYSMTAHARGGLFLVPDARAALDIGALHGRVIRMDERGKVLDYRMTSQCASGSGQFLESISRYLGVALDEIGELSRRADDPEAVSSICAVLAETDVINMVSRGISTPNILKGIHLSMAGRLIKLIKAARIEGVVAVTGGLAADEGLIAAMTEAAAEREFPLDLRPHPESALAGAIGAAIWGAFRHRKLSRLAPAG